MRFLVIGLGSMGKRRIRCLQALGYKEVFGFDLRQDRCEEVQQKYGVKTGTNFEQMFSLANPDRFIISVPPDLHHIYMKKAIEYKKHAFVEASVVDKDYELIKQGARANSVKIIPSATMLFHPGIQMIGNFMKEGKLGKISNVLFHSGQYLPDWHTYEKVSDFYVSNPVTGGAREIVPFELTWVLHYLGFPKRVSGNARKTISIEGAEKIDDTYNFLLDYDNYLATITIDVVSRHSSRRLVINGEKAQLFWDWDRKCIEVYNKVKGAAEW